jgi:hypothetical protein
MFGLRQLVDFFNRVGSVAQKLADTVCFTGGTGKKLFIDYEICGARI